MVLLQEIGDHFEKLDFLSLKAKYYYIQQQQFYTFSNYSNYLQFAEDLC